MILADLKYGLSESGRERLDKHREF